MHFCFLWQRGLLREVTSAGPQGMCGVIILEEQRCCSLKDGKEKKVTRVFAFNSEFVPSLLNSW